MGRTVSSSTGMDAQCWGALHSVHRIGQRLESTATVALLCSVARRRRSCSGVCGSVCAPRRARLPAVGARLCDVAAVCPDLDARTERGRGLVDVLQIAEASRLPVSHDERGEEKRRGGLRGHTDRTGAAAHWSAHTGATIDERSADHTDHQQQQAKAKTMRRVSQREKTGGNTRNCQGRSEYIPRLPVRVSASICVFTRGSHVVCILFCS